MGSNRRGLVNSLANLLRSGMPRAANRTGICGQNSSRFLLVYRKLLALIAARPADIEAPFIDVPLSLGLLTARSIATNHCWMRTSFN